MNIKVVVVRVEDLGFPEGALTREIIGSEADQDIFGNPTPFTGGRCHYFGFGLCPPEIGPLHCLKCIDQPVFERLYIAMKPINLADGVPRIFLITHNAKGLSLDTAKARPDDQWAPDDKFMFSIGYQSLLEEILERKKAK